MLRWSLKVTFTEVRAHLGVETQRQWSDKAIRRTTPVLMGIFSIVCLIADIQNKLANDLIQTTSSAWYDKEDNAIFSDVLIYVKRLIINGKYINVSGTNNDFMKIHRREVDTLINNAFMAA